VPHAGSRNGKGIRLCAEVAFTYAAVAKSAGTRREYDFWPAGDVNEARYAREGYSDWIGVRAMLLRRHPFRLPVECFVSTLWDEFRPAFRAIPGNSFRSVSTADRVNGAG
jgi:hypothetical protein